MTCVDIYLEEKLNKLATELDATQAERDTRHVHCQRHHCVACSSNCGRCRHTLMTDAF